MESGDRGMYTGGAMERVTVRVAGVGPIGFCKVVTPCCLAVLRTASAFAKTERDPATPSLTSF
jgi:hypothetical protein